MTSRQKPTYTPAKVPQPDDSEAQQRALNEEQREKAEAVAKRRDDFEKAKQDALSSMKIIMGPELGLTGLITSDNLGANGLGDTKTLFSKPSPGSAAVNTQINGTSKLDIGQEVNYDIVHIQDGVPDAAHLKKDLLNNFSGLIQKRGEQSNEQAQQIIRSFKTAQPPSPIKTIDNLAPGDVILVAPVMIEEDLKDESKQHLKDVVISNGINLMDRWGSDNWSSPASHAAIYLGERNGKRWYLDNTGKGPIIKEESEFLKEYGARKMDVATLVGQPLSRHEGEEMWKGAHELRNMTAYGPSKILNWGRDDGMVCSESSRWLLLRAGRRVPETQSENGKILGMDIGLNKKQFVSFSPSDFYANQQYFLVHRLEIRKKVDTKP